jgi:hypothetical protein
VLLLFVFIKVGFRIIIIPRLLLVIMDLSKRLSVESLHLRSSIGSIRVTSVHSKLLIVLLLLVLEWLLLILKSSLRIVAVCSVMVVVLILH